MFGFCVDILGCFKRKKTGLFSLFLQMLVPFSRRPDTEDQLKKGVHIYFKRKVQTTSTKWWSHSNVCSVWVEPRCSTLFTPLGLPNKGFFLGQNEDTNADKGHRWEREKNWSYKRNPEHKKPTIGKKKKRRQQPKNRHQQLNKLQIWQERLEADKRRTNNDWGEDGDLNTQGLIN